MQIMMKKKSLILLTLENIKCKKLLQPALKMGCLYEAPKIANSP